MRYRTLLFVPALMFFTGGCPRLADDQPRPDLAYARHEPAPAAAVRPMVTASPPVAAPLPGLAKASEPAVVEAPVAAPMRAWHPPVRKW